MHPFKSQLYRKPSYVLLLILFLTMGFMIFPAGIEMGWTKERMTLGEVEEVILLPWGLRLPARIDTGAATTSLDAQDLKMSGNVAEFRLPKKYGSLLLRVPVKEWREIRSADSREKRPIVELTFCIGPKKLRGQVTLNDRSTVRYPLVIGRNLLKDNFVVDCTQSNCLPPSCPENPSK
jgi:hypothetical protein